tara:strand:+ start:893 stop:1195 length:303 start_codon:yes stop_codon:yes gene_type:complete
MAMQTDVKSAHSSASVVSGGELVVSGRYRLKSVVMASNTTAGTAIFRDGSATGPILLELDSGTNSNVSTVLMPGQGILFSIGIFYVPTTVAPIGVTIIYG